MNKREEAYVTLSKEDSDLLDSLLQNETKPQDANSLNQLIPYGYELAEFLKFFSFWSKEQKANNLGQLIPHGYELAECLQFFSFWSKEQKANFVLAYLHTKSRNEQDQSTSVSER